MLHEGLVWKISMGGASPLRGAGPGVHIQMGPRGGRGCHQISIFPKFKIVYIILGGGGQENYGLFPQFVRFFFWKAPLTRFLLPDTCCLILFTECDQCCSGNSASHYSDQNMKQILVDFCRTTVRKIMEDIKIDMKRLSDQSLRKTAIVELRKCSDMYHYVDILISKML